MKCPYCASPVPREAVVCAVCRRDFYLLKPLLGRVAELEAEVEALTAALAKARPAEVDVEAAPPAPIRAADWAIFLGVPLLGLLLAHYLIVVLFDLPVLHLRVVSLLLPLPFGYLLWRRQRRSMAYTLAGAIAMALLAVLGMSAVIGRVDGVPVLPVTGQEWREFVEYAASIFFSYFTGVIFGRREIRLRERLNSEMLLKMAKLIHGGVENVKKVEATVKKLNDMATSVGVAATTGLSIIAGLKGYVG